MYLHFISKQSVHECKGYFIIFYIVPNDQHTLHVLEHSSTNRIVSCLPQHNQCLMMNNKYKEVEIFNVKCEDSTTTSAEAKIIIEVIYLISIKFFYFLY